MAITDPQIYTKETHSKFHPENLVKMNAVHRQQLAKMGVMPGQQATPEQHAKATAHVLFYFERAHAYEAENNNGEPWPPKTELYKQKIAEYEARKPERDAEIARLQADREARFAAGTLT